MIQIGNKIRKIRELKNITPKDMADRLNMTPQGYHKIEREESGITLDRLEEIAQAFNMKPEDVLTFDEKYVFHNYEGSSYNQPIGPNYFQFPEELRKLYDENAKLQEEKNKLQAEMIEMLKERLKIAEGK